MTTPAPPSLHARFQLGDMFADYLCDNDGHIGLRLLPVARADDCVAPRAAVPDPGGSPKVRALDPLLHVHAAGWPLPVGFAAGRTQRHSAINYGLHLKERRSSEEDGKGGITIITTLQHDCGLQAEHRLQWQANWQWLRISSSVRNLGSDTIRLEMVSGAVLGDLTPFAADDAPGSLFLHRFRSAWSAEGRHEERALEDLQLERSWAGFSMQCERFGQVGSMPVRGWFPWVGLEDRQAGVTWALQPDAPASWQCDCLRRDDGVSIAAGPADHEFGHWWRDLAPGGIYEAHAVSAVCVVGGVDEACEALVAAIDHGVESPAAEQHLPVAFNEWCSSWGNPAHDAVCAVAKALDNSKLSYLTIDAGWFLPSQGEWHNAQGDWIPNASFFPDGIHATAAAIRAAGFIPGLWFEWEVMGFNSQLWERHDWLLQRHGVPITIGHRRFLDLRKEAVREHLRERLIGLLRSANFGYLKMDYNDTVGIGPDGRHGPGAELEEAILAAQDFVREIRQALPELVIECCASGGHRLEPSWLRLVSQASFSDVHEGRSIPIVAANLQRLVPARQNQIWAVLREGESTQRSIWSLCAGFLGRLCISGTVNAENRPHIDAAVSFAAAAAPIIAQGSSRIFGNAGQGSWNHPQGWQVVRRCGPTGCLVVVHCFAGETAALRIPFPQRQGEIYHELSCNGHASIKDGTIHITLPGDGDRAGAWLIR